MNSIRLFCLLFICVLLVLTQVQGVDNRYTQRRRRTKELDDKINKLDDATKARIHAMKASGMPKEAIAEKISYVAGGKGTAKRIVDALHDEPPKRPKQPKANTKKKSARSSL